MLSLFLFMVKSGKSFVKIESPLHIALLFFFYQNFQPPPPFSAYSNPPAYLILPNAPYPPPPRLLGPIRLFET